jgi:hypothetical protein
VPNSSSVTPWSLTMAAGSLQQYNFTFTEVSPATGQLIPYPISGATWEYVARTSPTDLTSPPLIDITTASTSAGQIVVTSTAAVSQAQLTILPAATVSLAPGTYAHTLWMNPGSSSAFTWVTGQLIIAGNPQP